MNNTAFRDLHRTIDVSTYGKANIVVSSSPGRRGFRHPICAACQILNQIQVRFQILELQHHRPHFHYYTPRPSKLIIQ